MARLLLLALLVVSSSASAIVIRDDVDDSKYRIAASDFPALADMPGEGHGVLIAPQWVITAAHAIAWQSEPTGIIEGTSVPVAHDPVETLVDLAHLPIAMATSQGLV